MQNHLTIKKDFDSHFELIEIEVNKDNLAVKFVSKEIPIFTVDMNLKSAVQLTKGLIETLWQMKTYKDYQDPEFDHMLKELNDSNLAGWLASDPEMRTFCKKTMEEK